MKPHIGAALGILGALGHTAIAIVNLIFVEMPRVGDRAAMLALLDRLNDSTAVLVVFPLILSFAFGMLLLSVALWRARGVPVWIPLGQPGQLLGLRQVGDGTMKAPIGCQLDMTAVVEAPHAGRLQLVSEPAKASRTSSTGQPVASASSAKVA